MLYVKYCNWTQVYERFSASELQLNTRFEAFTAMNIQVEVFWIMIPHSVVVGYRRFGGRCCLLRRNPEDHELNCYS